MDQTPLLIWGFSVLLDSKYSFREGKLHLYIKILNTSIPCIYIFFQPTLYYLIYELVCYFLRHSHCCYSNDKALSILMRFVCSLQSLVQKFLVTQFLADQKWMFGGQKCYENREIQTLRVRGKLTLLLNESVYNLVVIWISLNTAVKRRTCAMGLRLTGRQFTAQNF